MNNVNENIKEAAVKYAGAGMRIMPLCSFDHKGMSDNHCSRCCNPGKAPIVGNWRKQASTDLNVVAQWFDKYKTANIGMLTGITGGIVAIDIDGKYGRERLEEISGGQVPATWEFTTPGEGYRYLYAASGTTSLKKFTDARTNADHQEIAFLGDGQQTVLPPSRHKNGGTYEWVEGRSPAEIEIAPAPDWMLKIMSPVYNPDLLFDDADPLEGLLATPSSSMFTTTSTSTSTKANQIALGSEPDNSTTPKLNSLVKRCPAIADAVELQTTGGCDEDKWFKTISLLCRVGAAEEALAFSRLSRKHNVDSEGRIAKIKTEAGENTFGPVRCTTLGCGTDQIRRCFGDLNRNASGELTNSPARLLTDDQQDLERASSLLKRTRYRIHHGKLGEPSFNKNGEENGFSYISNFIAIPVRDVRIDNGADDVRWFGFEGLMLTNGKQLPPLKVKHTDFAGLSKLEICPFSREATA